MTVKRIVANVAATSVSDVRDFYAALFGLEVVMDHGWIVTLASGAQAITQISVASEGGSGTPVRTSRSRLMMWTRYMRDRRRGVVKSPMR